MIIYGECGRLAASAGKDSVWGVTLSLLASELFQAVLEPPWYVGAGQKGWSFGVVHQDVGRVLSSTGPYTKLHK